MRHFDQLADSVRDGLFHLAPESFDRDSERQVLANALGATLYVPATKDGLAAELLHAQALRFRIATVARRTASFLMCHGLYSSYLDQASAAAGASAFLAAAFFFGASPPIARILRIVSC